MKNIIGIALMLPVIIVVLGVIGIYVWYFIDQYPVQTAFFAMIVSFFAGMAILSSSDNKKKKRKNG